MKTRLFIGNLASTVTEQDLKSKFDSLLASHKGEAEVGNVEVRCKNEDNYFGYVDIHVNNVERKEDAGGRGSGIPLYLRKYIDLMNNTKWKGSLIKVQLAKESFIEKLKREQQENMKKEGGAAGKSDADARQNGWNNKPTVFAEFTTRKNANGENASEQSMNQRQANDVLHKMMNRSRDRGNKRANFQDCDSKIDSSKDCGFEIVVGKGNREDKTKKSPVKSSPEKQSQRTKKQSKSRQSSSSSEDESDDEIRDGIPKFKGLLLCYPDGLPTAPVSTHQEEESKPVKQEENVEDRKIQKKLLSFYDDSVGKTANETTNEAHSTKSAVNFKRNKQQQSDFLRLQSLEKMKELKAQRKSLIKSSLSSVVASAPVSEQRKILEDDEISEESEPTKKKAKMSLFDEDDDDEEDSEEVGDAFQVKKQFEGTGGQKLLELKTRWGNDDRFKIDDRFKESDEEEAEPFEQEKEKQLDILTHILGKDVSSKPLPSKTVKTAVAAKTFSSVIMPRYDPEEDDENETVVQVDQDMKIEKDKKKKTNKKPEENVSATGEKKVRTTEPATFKTVSNLKALFSSSDNNESGSGKNANSLLKATVNEPESSFSLLATFGNKTEDKTDLLGTSKTNSTEGPRSFWQSNPFRYDSSDDEDDTVKVSIKTKVEKSAPVDLVVHGKAAFFFTENDARLEGLEDYFIKSNEPNAVENEDDTNPTSKDAKEDFAVKRQELKSIVKAKIRNSRRKDEKRTLAIKRSIRKKKRKIQQRGKTVSKY